MGFHLAPRVFTKQRLYRSLFTFGLVLEYDCWYAANIVTKSIFNTLSIGSGPVAAVLLCIKRGHHLLAWVSQPHENETIHVGYKY